MTTTIDEKIEAAEVVARAAWKTYRRAFNAACRAATRGAPEAAARRAEAAALYAEFIRVRDHVQELVICRRIGIR